MYTWMSDPKAHNYAFRKALGYVRNKRGRAGSDSVRETFQHTTHQMISIRSPYMPSYLPLKSFVIILQIIKNSLGDKKIVTSDRKTDRCYDVGFYLYTGPEEGDSPYHYLDPHKPLSDVVSEFYHNLATASAIFKNCETELTIEDSKIKIKWKGCEEYIELFYYLEGLHAGMIKESISDGVQKARKTRDNLIFEIELIE